jgi:hypothetical protein
LSASSARSRPRGGGTLILSGSPRLLASQERGIPADQRRGLDTRARERFYRLHPWLMALTGQAPSPADRISAFMDGETIVEGVPLRVVELTGQPGDMVFCHPAMVHCRAPNRGTHPRFMRIKQQFLTHEARTLLRNWLGGCPPSGAGRQPGARSSAPRALMSHKSGCGVQGASCARTAARTAHDEEGLWCREGLRAWEHEEPFMIMTRGGWKSRHAPRTSHGSRGHREGGGRGGGCGPPGFPVTGRKPGGVAGAGVWPG